jgi:hypothetical protein
MEPNTRVMRLDPSMEDAIRNNRCYIGGEQVFYQPVSEHDEQKASGPGHIYSEAGLREYKQSGTCEYHFDNMFADPDDLVDELEIDSYSEPLLPEEEEMAPPDEKIL